ncbi:MULTISPECIES: acyltransferase family protein [Microcella]|uniref:acyltransferase family protein n=1 Tax=Microcella TaxID=337004 RepID=UPI0015CF03E0|nr:MULTISPECIES: acyltransferase family protein [Microcella]QOD92983.1 acyltransferase [Chryseoglobus sp. 28M-23]
MTSTSLDRAPANARPTTERLRPEIQGLRAVAVALVFAYHLWPERLPGGFIGVDMFFVISGYLIIGHLVREIRDTGRIRLARFWERRARRILPLALVVLSVVAAATWFLSEGEDKVQYLEEIIASVFFVENWLLASNAVDYLRADYEPSPVQHFWSLAVEEQFYIFLPIVIALTALVMRRRGRIGYGPIRVVLVVLFVVSFIASVMISSSAGSVAYFATPIRLWEFLAGGLLSMAVISIGPALRGLLAISGTALVVFSAFGITGESSFPGWIAALPVVGTLLIIASGSSTWFARLSSLRPVLWVGGISYGVYLWHWPLIHFTPGQLDQIGLAPKIVIVVLALALASATKIWVEDPVRFSRRLQPALRPSIKVASAALLSMSLVAGAAFAGVLSVQREQAELLDYLASVESNDFPCFGAQAADPGYDCSAELDYPILPPLSTIRSDDANRAECWSGDSPASLNVCSLGPMEGYERRAIALGDSFNAALISAYELAAEENNWRIDVASRRSCAWSNAGTTAARSEDCLAWNQLVTNYLDTGPQYDLILTTAAGREPSDALVTGYREAWASATSATGAHIVVIATPPKSRPDHVECLKDNRDDMNASCSITRADAFKGIDGISVAAQSAENVSLVDLSRVICPGDPCLPVVGNAIIFRNGGHITRTFATTLGPYLAAELTVVDTGLR